jgi:uncharacterized protein involved in tellurium resistance
MSRPVANVDVITDSFEIWLLETNELLHALSTEIITANTTYANTGNTAFPRTAQLYGTFGANNLVVTDWLKGGNVNGSFANLMISTNTVLSNVNATAIRLEVANGSSNTFMWQYGLHAGLASSNLVANTTNLKIQAGAATNTTVNALSVVVANSTNSATMNAIGFSTGLFIANTIQITLGANVTANATNGGTIQVTGSVEVGNSVSNSSGLYVGNTVTNSQMTSVRFFAAEGSNTVLANNQIIRMVNSTSSANIDPISFKTGIFTANTIEISLGANVTANATNGGTIQVTGSGIVGNTVSNSSGTFVGNTLNASQITSVRFLTQEGSNTTLANTRIISIANSTNTATITPISFNTGLFTANTIQITLGANVTANATNGGTIQVTGSADVGNTVANSSGVFVGNSLNSAEHTAIRFLATEGSNTTLANTRIISIANSIATANIEPNAFTTGRFTANTIQISLGANVTANAINGGTIQITGSADVGNTVSNSSGTYVGNSLNASQLTAVRFFTAEGANTTLANTRIISIANSIATANIEPNAFKTGLFTANTIQVSVGANVFANATTVLVGNATFNTVIGNGSITALANLTVTATDYVRIVGAVNVSSNATFANTLAVAGSTTLSNTLAVTGSTTLSNTLSVTGAANVLSTFGVGGAANLASTLGVVGATALANTLGVTGVTTLGNNATVAGTLGVTGASTLSNTLTVTGSTTLSNTLGVAGTTTISNTLSVSGTSTFGGAMTIKTEHVVDVFANGNLGATTASDLLMFEYPKADYSSAKLLIQLKNAGNTQISEVLLAHDTSSAQLTTYGTVSSPVSSNSGVSLLGTFSANVDTTNVRVYVKQTTASTAAKVVAQFIK